MLDITMAAHTQWASRPDDERFCSLTELHAFLADQKERSTARVLSNRRLLVKPGDSHEALLLETADSADTSPTNWSFGQLAALAQSPAGFLKTLPSDMVADILNYKLRRRPVEEIGILQTEDSLRAATGPNYGRVWNAEVIRTIMDRVGDGVTGDWRVPGEFGKALDRVTKANTTLYASDRDFFIFLADEVNRVELPDRRDGEAGSFARGILAWNSEVGSQTVGIDSFYFDYVCCNRIIWGAKNHQRRTLRHTSGAPDRWLEDMRPAMTTYLAADHRGDFEAAVLRAQAAKVDDVDDFLTKRFSAGRSRQFRAAFEDDEGRPMETIFDAVTGITAFARGIAHQDERVLVEREAGKLLDLVAE